MALGVVHSDALTSSRFSVAQAAVSELRALAASSTNSADATNARLCSAQLELARGRLQPAFRESIELLDIYRSRGQIANLVPVLLVLAEVHQNAESPLGALPHVLSALSLCEAFSMDGFRDYALTMLAELQLRLGAPEQAVALLDEAMPRLLEHAPSVLQANAQHTLGVCQTCTVMLCTVADKPCLWSVQRARLALASTSPTVPEAETLARAAISSLEKSLNTFLSAESLKR